MNPAAVLLVLLACSLAGNAWQAHRHDLAIAAQATAEQLNRDTTAAAAACSSSVDKLATETVRRTRSIQDQLAASAGRIASLQTSANTALATRPADPADLCGSVTKYLQGQIRQERAGATQ